MAKASTPSRRYQPRLSFDEHDGEVFESLMEMPEEQRKSQLTFWVRLGFVAHRSLERAVGAALTGAAAAGSAMASTIEPQAPETRSPTARARSADELAGDAVAGLLDWNLEEAPEEEGFS
jgi:hypothetical protein